MNLIIPMSGQGIRYQKAGHQLPKPMIPVSGSPMIERVLKNFPENWKCHFVIAENHLSTGLPELLKRLRPDSSVLSVPVHQEGPIKAIEKALESIPDGEEVFVSYCDYGVVWDSGHFIRFIEQTKCDAVLVSYRGFHPHYLSEVKYAYSRLDGERVVEVKEKGSFTENRQDEFASTGGYYFRSSRQLKSALEYQRKHSLSMNGEFYTSLTVEALLRLFPEAHVRIFEVPYFFQWGTPQDLADFEYWERTFQKYNAALTAPANHVDQVLMPMAGRGARFEMITNIPKPFIPLAGKRMFERALESLPGSLVKTVVISLDAHKQYLENFKAGEVKLLKSTPGGQALTTRAGIDSLQNDSSLIVSSCDHSIVLSHSSWSKFLSKNDCDAAIFTVRGFPGIARRPEAYAYVETVGKEEFPPVQRVSVKTPISSSPQKDQLLVGTFWFRDKSILELGINELVTIGKQINGEMYLDSIFELLIKKGLKVRTIPLDGYINWGDPESLAEALYWFEVYCGHGVGKRSNLPGIV